MAGKWLRMAVHVAALTGMLVVCATAGQDDQGRIAALEKQIAALQNQVQEMNAERGNAQAAAGSELETRVRDLEGRMAERAADESPFAAGWKDGKFTLQSSDGAHTLTIGGRIAIDGIWYAGNKSTEEKTNDGFIPRRIRLGFSGQVYKYFKYKLETKWDKGSTILDDAWMDIVYFDPVNLRIGVQKPPISHEDLQSSGDIHLMERSLMNSLVPDRETGVMFHGHPMKLVEYQVAYMNGTDKPSSGDNNDDEDVLVRAMLTPFASQDNKWLKGLAVGGNFSWGNQDAPFSGGNVPGATYKTPSGVTYYTWNGRAEGSRTRYGAEFMWYAGPFHANAEWLSVEQHSNTAAMPTRMFTTRSWYVEGGYVLTGEDASIKGVKPANNFDPRNGKWGAVEVVVRYSNMMADTAAIHDGYASGYPTADEYGACANWYLNELVRLQLMYDHVYMMGNSSRTEDAIMFRFQIKF